MTPVFQGHPLLCFLSTSLSLTPSFAIDIMASSTTYVLLIAVALLVLLPGRAEAFGAGNIASISAIEGKNWRHGDIEDMLATVACLKGHKWKSMMIKVFYTSPTNGRAAADRVNSACTLATGFETTPRYEHFPEGLCSLILRFLGCGRWDSEQSSSEFPTCVCCILSTNDR